MGAEKAFQALATQLHGADDRTLLKLVAVVDQLAKRGSLDQLLDEHRARLAVIRPPRPMTLGRLVVLPLEELLIDGADFEYIERHAQDIIKMKRRLNEVYVKHTGQSYEAVETTLDRDHFMTAEESQAWGLIDKVIEKREAASE